MKSPTLLNKVVELVCEALLQTFIFLCLSLAGFFALLNLVQTAHASSASVSPYAHRLTIQLTRESDGAKASMSCSSVAVAPRTLLTATHCFEVGPGVKVSGLLVDGKPVLVEKHETDGADHSLVVLRHASFTKHRPLKPSATLYTGQEVELHGWPAGYGKLYRRGVVAGQEERVKAGYTAWLLDLNGGQGDSGAGLYDTKTGALVGVVSYLSTGAPGEERVRLTGVFGFRFTGEQLAVVK